MNEKSTNVLAIDQATRHCSIAINSGQNCLAETAWDSKLMHNQDLFDHLPEMLKKAGLSLTDIDCIAIDTGPGSFAGIRTSLSAANGMLIPDKKPVAGISIGEILAEELKNKYKEEIITVVGDARRNRLWCAQFHVRPEGVIQTEEYTLASRDEFPGLLADGSLLASPDFDRLEEYFEESLPGTVTVVREQCIPAASVLAQLTVRKISDGTLDQTPPSPLYMHPAVDKKPAL